MGMGANAPRQRKDRRHRVLSAGTAAKAITGHFTAPTFAEILAWGGYSRTFADHPLYLAVFQYICAQLEGRKKAEMPANQIAAHLRCSIRTVRRACNALRLEALIITTVTAQDGRDGRPDGGNADYWLRFMAGPELRRLTGYDPRKRTVPQTVPSDPPATADKSFIHNEKTPLHTPEFSRVIRGDMMSSPNPITKETNKHRSTPPPVENSRARRNGARGGGVPVVSKKGRLIEALYGALGEGGDQPNAIDQRSCHAVAAVALDLGLSSAAVSIARYAGRARWVRRDQEGRPVHGRGSIMVQRFVDYLDDYGLGAAIPAHWQHKRRAQLVRVTHSIEGLRDE